MESNGELALVTGASSGIGKAIARRLASEGFEVIVAAEDSAGLQRACSEMGGNVRAVTADLRREDEVDRLWRTMEDGGRPLSVLVANAGTGVGGAFLDTDLQKELDAVDVNVRSVVQLVKHAARHMVRQGAGRILITGSIAGEMPGAFQAVYNGTKAFLNSFSEAIREEMKDSGVSVTVLLPGATDTNFFHRAGMDDTKVGQSKKAAAGKVANDGVDAMLDGDDEVISGFMNKVMVAVARVVPDRVTAHIHRGMSEPNDLKATGDSSQFERGEAPADRHEAAK